MQKGTGCFSKRDTDKRKWGRTLLSKVYVPFAICVSLYSTLWIHPSGASMCPIWIPVSVSYNILVIGPISSIPLGKQISFPWSLILPTGEMTAAVPHRPHSAKSLTSSKYTGRSSTSSPDNALPHTSVNVW